MARALSKGKTIGVQLPLATDVRVRQMALEAGTSPGVWISHMVATVIEMGEHAEPPTVTDLVETRTMDGHGTRWAKIDGRWQRR